MLQAFNGGRVWIAPETTEIKATSKPAHAKSASGVCLVVGSAPCVHRDVEEALLAYPDAKICAVNDAAGLVMADYLATCHGEKIEQFIGAHEKSNNDMALPEIHVKDAHEVTTERPCFRWTISIGAGSAPFAAAVMALIGFDLVILCGCPMDGGGGYAMPTHKSTPEDPRFGELDPSHSMVTTWKNQLEHMQEQHPELCSKIRSMSGHTQQVFGSIENAGGIS